MTNNNDVVIAKNEDNDKDYNDDVTVPSSLLSLYLIHALSDGLQRDRDADHFVLTAYKALY